MPKRLSLQIMKQVIEDQRRINATKSRIEDYRTEYKEIDNDILFATIESLYPNRYVHYEEITLEVVKELIRDSKPLTTDTFADCLKSLTDKRKLARFDKDAIKAREFARKLHKLMSKIYNDAQKATVKLTDYPEFDAEMISFFEQRLIDKHERIALSNKELKGTSKYREIHLVQEVYYQLNLEAMQKEGEDEIPRCNYLNFGCYELPDGEIVFSKEPIPGKGVYRAVETERVPYNVKAPEDNSKPESKSGSGFKKNLIVILAILLVLATTVAVLSILEII